MNLRGYGIPSHTLFFLGFLAEWSWVVWAFSDPVNPRTDFGRWTHSEIEAQAVSACKQKLHPHLASQGSPVVDVGGIEHAFSKRCLSFSKKIQFKPRTGKLTDAIKTETGVRISKQSEMRPTRTAEQLHSQRIDLGRHHSRFSRRRHPRLQPTRSGWLECLPRFKLRVASSKTNPLPVPITAGRRLRQTNSNTDTSSNALLSNKSATKAQVKYSVIPMVKKVGGTPLSPKNKLWFAHSFRVPDTCKDINSCSPSASIPYSQREIKGTFEGGRHNWQKLRSPNVPSDNTRRRAVGVGGDRAKLLDKKFVTEGQSKHVEDGSFPRLGTKQKDLHQKKTD
ncbi:hypothetical protein CROQUDRAFT_715476 [Cronartium quercuum f. sp. fusiforme G11]|uniref:Uncharacterized protein n=1 Tax=Cronartium quercuum f. sp. fusiforme G11 TaxID=708437 RepID=A0A9P6NII3_9BASI|nr:hypothetical protein CROQUDRAFT_715476 [Cronartium quercuum f. sp. fusiforme G11]